MISNVYPQVTLKPASPGVSMTQTETPEEEGHFFDQSRSFSSRKSFSNPRRIKQPFPLQQSKQGLYEYIRTIKNWNLRFQHRCIIAIFTSAVLKGHSSVIDHVRSTDPQVHLDHPVSFIALNTN